MLAKCDIQCGVEESWRCLLKDRPDSLSWTYISYHRRGSWMLPLTLQLVIAGLGLESGSTGAERRTEHGSLMRDLKGAPTARRIQGSSLP